MCILNPESVCFLLFSVGKEDQKHKEKKKKKKNDSLVISRHEMAAILIQNFILR